MSDSTDSPESVLGVSDIAELPGPGAVREYHGSSALPNLITEEGVAEFYAGFDRGQTNAENPGAPRPCDLLFMELLFEDFETAVEERLFRSEHAERSNLVLRTTKKELRRLFEAPELFHTPRLHRWFCERVRDAFHQRNCAEQSVKKCSAVMREMAKKEAGVLDKSLEQRMNPRYKENLAPWSQFLTDGAPGASNLPWAQGALASQMVPAGGVKILEAWQKKYDEALKKPTNIETDYDPQEDSESDLQEVEKDLKHDSTTMRFKLSPSPFVKILEPRRPFTRLSLLQANNYIDKAVDSKEKPVDRFADGFPCELSVTFPLSLIGDYAGENSG